MSEVAYENLDLACAEWGQRIAQEAHKELENLLRNALAVLEEQGVYALFLYLHQERQEVSRDIFTKLQEFMQKTPKKKPLLPAQQEAGKNDDEKTFLQTLRGQLACDLDKLLLAQDLLQQTLIYALYHVRAQVEVSQP